MILILVFSMIGWLSVHRIISILRSKKVLDEKTNSFLQGSVLALALLPPAFQFSMILVGVYFLILMIGAFLLPKIIEEKRRQEFLKNRIFAVDVILLAVQSGKSFRQALLDVKNTEMNYGYYIHEMVCLVLLREDFVFKATDPLALRFYRELKIFEGMSHKIAERIKSFRGILKIEEQFRQKSRTATLQARAQSIIVGILYLLAWIFNVMNYGTSLDSKMLDSSMLLFVLGTVWIWKMGKTHRWTV
jgi:hypothetical protein